MKPQLPLFVTLAMAANSFACDLPEEDIGFDESAIINGGGLGPTPEISFGLGLTEAGCTVTFLENNDGLTTRTCAAKSSKVTVGGITKRIRVVREVVDSSRNKSPEVVAINLNGRVKLAGNPFTRRADPTPVKDGERLDCFGFFGGKLTSGVFEVADGSGTHLNLKGRLGFNGPWAISKEDLGGFCARDGSFNVAAILIKETTNGIATAARTHDLSRGVADVLYAAEVAHNGAVRLLDAEYGDFLTARTVSPYGERLPQLAHRTSQAFILDRISNPPAGGFDWYRLVDVVSGECLTAPSPIPRAPTLVRIEPCDVSALDQMFFATSIYKNGRDHYSFHVANAGPNNRVLDAKSQVLQVLPSASVPSQQFTMQLTSY